MSLQGLPCCGLGLDDFTDGVVWCVLCCVYSNLATREHFPYVQDHTLAWYALTQPVLVPLPLSELLPGHSEGHKGVRRSFAKSRQISSLPSRARLILYGLAAALLLRVVTEGHLSHCFIFE